MSTCRHAHALFIYCGFVCHRVCLFTLFTIRRLFLRKFFVRSLRGRPASSNTCVSSSSKSDTNRCYFTVYTVFCENFSCVDKKDSIVCNWCFVRCQGLDQLSSWTAAFNFFLIFILRLWRSRFSQLINILFIFMSFVTFPS